MVDIGGGGLGCRRDRRTGAGLLHAAEIDSPLVLVGHSYGGL